LQVQQVFWRCVALCIIACIPNFAYFLVDFSLEKWSWRFWR